MRRAFTILEMLAATALTALLMLAVLHVIGSLGRTRAAMARQPDAGPWRADLLDTLRRDLGNSIAVRYDAGGVTLTGHSGLDPATLAPTHEPVTVTYGLTTLAGRTWLYRRQASRVGGGPGAWQELLCAGVTAFAVRPATAALSHRETPRDPDAQALPPAVVIEIDGPGGMVVRETMVVP